MRHSGAAAIGVITNPNSRKNIGRTDRVGELQRIVGARGLVRQTRSTAELVPVLEEFARREVRTWVTDGGDGSLHWLLNVASARFGGPGALPGRLPCAVPANGGTIDFVARHVGLRGRAEDILRCLLAHEAEGRAVPTVSVPTLILRGERDATGGGREPFERVGFTAALAGIASGFFDQYYADSSGGGPRAILSVIARGAASYALDGTPLRALVPDRWLAYGRVLRAPVAGKVTVDGVELPYRELTAMNVGAFPINLGGVIRVFDRAGDGRLHVFAGEVSDLDSIRNIPRLIRGRPPRAPRLFDGDATHIRAEATGETPFRGVMDGEFVDGIRLAEIVPGPAVAIPRLNAKRRPRR